LVWDYYIAFRNFWIFLLFSIFLLKDQVSLGQAFLIRMLFFVTIGNCEKIKSKVCNVLSNLDGNIILSNIFSMFLVSVNTRKHPLCFWWKKSTQYKRWDLVETNVWHTTLEMRFFFFFLLHYRMKFEIINNLVLELTFFW
jgi:hypothetical protein